MSTLPMPDDKKKCFIIMPITTPANHLSTYGNDSIHFQNILHHLFIPAIEKAGLQPIKPIAKGADMIHREIIRNLETADLVLCDMSIFNPNVFFELGVRVSLNKPICLVKDDKTGEIPFDVAPINHYTYDCMPLWRKEEEIASLSEHIKTSFQSSNNKNWLWQLLSFNVKAEPLSENSSMDTKVDYLIRQMEKMQLTRSKDPSTLAKRGVHEAIELAELYCASFDYDRNAVGLAPKGFSLRYQPVEWAPVQLQAGAFAKANDLSMTVANFRHDGELLTIKFEFKKPSWMEV